MFVDFSKQKYFTYPFPAKVTLICRRSSNLSSKQSVVRCVICTFKSLPCSSNGMHKNGSPSKPILRIYMYMNKLVP